MTYFTPCFNCAADKAVCERRSIIRKGIKDLGITSAKFKCPERLSKFRRGQRVAFDWRYYDNDSYRSEEYFATFYGTIMREQPGNKRFSIKVDQDHEDYDLKPAEILKNAEFTSARPADIRAIDEPDRTMCEWCQAYADDDADIARLCVGLDGDGLVGCFKQ